MEALVISGIGAYDAGGAIIALFQYFRCPPALALGQSLDQ